MELFVINRYTGDDSAQEQTSNEELLRKKLLKTIKKRKKQFETVEDHPDFKHKKRKESEINQDENIISQNEESSYLNGTVESAETSLVESENDIKTPDKVKKKSKNKKKIKPENQKNKTSTIENGVEDENKEENRLEDENKGENGVEDIPSTQEEIQGNSFTILGNAHMSKKEKVKRKLPNWLANPSVVSVDLKNLTSTVDSIPELDEKLVYILKENGITHFFPVQSQVIPQLLKNAQKPVMYWPNDICVSAPTGSGKTLAFVLPILQILSKRIIPKIRALVVLPVQDLANQVFSVFETYNKATNLNILLLSKIRPFEEEQFLICKNDGRGNYNTLVDIIVTTPGRLVDHLTKTRGLSLGSLQYLVIDEADRVMENVQNDWLYHLNKSINSDCNRSYQVPVISYSNIINKKRQPNKLLFSATLSQDPEKLQQLGLFQPKLFTSIVKTSKAEDNSDGSKFIGKYTTPAELTEFYISATKANKPLILHHIIKTRLQKNVLCFVNSAEATFRLAYVLRKLSQKEIKIDKLSANLTIKKRNMVLKDFANGDINVLISSDALARGIDISNVDYVVSYDAPKYIKTYIHRIGRTGRAGKDGTSIALLTPKEKNDFQKMIEIAGKTAVQELEINEEELHQYQNAYKKALKSLGSLLEKKKQKSILRVKTKKKIQMRAAKGKFVRKVRNKKKKKEKKSKKQNETILDS